MRLPSVESERRGRCSEVSSWVLVFVSGTRLPGFISSTTGFSRWPGQEQEAPSPVIFSKKATQTSGICFEVKFCYFQIEVTVMFCDDPRRLPSVCLGRGWYEFTSP